ncbi:MAG: Xaa-Pro peptidase family protein [Patescibacteria group bacterium]|nr:Xaa-Pro peptidase family protein [Patescibacteria group bacterium]
MNNRLSKVKNDIEKRKFDTILVSSVSNIAYLTGFSGFLSLEREAFLLITKDKNYILTDGRYINAVKYLIPDFELVEISSSMPFEKALEKLSEKHKIKKIGIEENNLTVLEHKTYFKQKNNIYHYNANVHRTIKEPQEISKIEKACRLTDKTFTHILKKMKSGITEKQLVFEIEFFIKKHGADIAFSPVVAFSENSAIPHHKSGERILEKGNIILMDFGAKINNYCSDMTRTIFFGKATAEQKKIYQTVLEAQQKAINYLKSLTLNHKSIKANSIDKIARDYILSKNYPTIPHGLGHGFGIDIHESPRLSPNSKDILKPGMVFSVEPGIYTEGFGGVRIEDTVVLEKTGPRILTQSTKKLIEISCVDPAG